MATCLFVFAFFVIEATAAQTTDRESMPPACVVAKPEPAKNKPKAAAKPAAKAKTVATAKNKTKPPAQPLVSAKTKAKAEAITSEIAPSLPNNLEQEIAKFFGMRYRFGGEGQGGIDCSGLVKEVYSNVFGIDLPHNSSEQSRLSMMQSVPHDELQTGDLVFFGPNRKRVNHVGVYLSGGHFLHAARSEGVTISKLNDSYWKSRFMFSKRVRGLEPAEEDDDDLDLQGDLSQDSLSFAFNSDGREAGFLDFGIRVNDSLELQLSGFFFNSLADPDRPHEVTASSAVLKQPESGEPEGGLRLSAILSPLEWFKMIPSISQMEGGNNDRNRDHQKLGLETWMILPDSRVAVFMAAYSRNQEDLFERPLAVSPDWQTMDVALGLHYHMSESLRFSLWGTYGYNPDVKVSEEPGRRNAPLDDVSFQLNIKF